MPALKLLLTLLWFSLSGLHVTCSQAADIPWKNLKISNYQFEQKKVAELLKEFSASQGISTVISPAVDGMVSGRFKFTPQDFLQFVCNTHGLLWYFDGNLLYVYGSDESYTQMIRLSYAVPEKINSTLKALKIADTRFALNYDNASNVMMVSGPKRYVELVQESIAFLEDSERAKAVDVKVFPLKYAWAQDQTISSGGRDLAIAGVASTLRNLLSNKSSVSSGPTPASAGSASGVSGGGGNVRSTAQSSASGAKSSPSSSTAASSSGGGAAPSASTNTASSGQNNDLPQIQADGRLNAVLVRDLPDRMGRYTDLIAALDVKSNMVEIEVAIMDVSSDQVESLGIDWRFRNSRIDAQIGLNPGTGASSLPSLRIGDFGIGGADLLSTAATVTQPVGALFSTVIGNAGRHILSRVSALSTNGQARVLSTPRVLTLDNLEANIDNSSTFYVQVTGTEKAEGQLFNVSVGTAVRVTPLIVMEEGLKKIRLSIRIEDGSILDQKIKEIPIVQKHSINTQAMINQGQALLIAGHTYETSKDAVSAVPGLSNLPLIGGLFKYNEKKASKVERIYLITPRIVGE